MGNITGISITGADNNTNLIKLSALAKEYKYVEFGLLYYPEKEGVQRNPTKDFRENFLSVISKDQTSIHLCGVNVFKEILNDNFNTSDLKEELSKFGRIQLNINARVLNHTFTSEEFKIIYNKLLVEKFNIIVQYNSISEKAILEFINNEKFNKQKFNVLLDSSLGKGITTSEWNIPQIFKKHFKIGFAGGLNSGNIFGEYLKIDSLTKCSYWLDLESGARTDNEFDLFKVQEILQGFIGEFE